MTNFDTFFFVFDLLSTIINDAVTVDRQFAILFFLCVFFSFYFFLSLSILISAIFITQSKSATSVIVCNALEIGIETRTKSTAKMN